MKKVFPFLFIVSIVFIFFWQFFLRGLLPIPSDTIVGLYHPFRDLYSKSYPNGIPFKNFLITDPIRQQYPWRKFVISVEKKFSLPLWNPYSFSGTPHLANLQSATFYPLNIVFFALPFSLSWVLLIIAQPLLAALFLYLFLANLKLSRWASLLGSITFAFCGFSIAWMEWGTIVHVGLWLPLILLAIDKIFIKTENSKLKIKNSKLQFKIKNYFWPSVFIFTLSSAFFAGHLQIFFYLAIFSWIYFFARWIQYGKIFNILYVFLILNILFLIVTSIQWVPTLQFIALSARNIDQVSFNNPGWFIPWQHLIQFVAPDFFGNPTTLNYWGVWNYAEFVGYVGIIPLILAIYSLFFRRDRKTLFFGTIFFLSLIFALPTFFAKIPYLLKIPFLDTSQPTRLLFLTTFSLSVLSALGFDYLLRSKKKVFVFTPMIFLGVIFAGLWFFMPVEHMTVVKNNLLLPTGLFISSAVLFLILAVVSKRMTRFAIAINIIIVGLTVFDLLRFGWKFTPFTNRDYLFPQTKAISFLQSQEGYFRIMTADSRILPPNFSIMYGLYSTDGYDPLYIRRYGELIAASERSNPNIDPPFGFNRIITPHNYDSKIIDLLGVKFVLSLSDLKSDKLKKVFQEGETRIYENKNVLPRAFFVEQVLYEKDKNQVMNALFRDDIDLRKIAVLKTHYQKENAKPQSVAGQLDSKRGVGKATIISYSENRVIVEAESPTDAGVLILTDTYYPTWRAKINNDYEIPILQVDYNFRGVIVPRGKYKIEFYNSLF